MNRGLLSNRRFILAAGLVAAFSVVAAVSRIFVGQDQQASTAINDSASVLSALVASISFVSVWISAGNQDVSKRIWGLVAVSMVAWTIAEILWGYYEVVLGQEVPYPSIADFLWIVGYFPLYAAMLIQYRLFQTFPSQRQRLQIALLAVVFALAAGFLVLKPIIEGFESERFLEGLVNIAYPVLDSVLLVLTLAIVFFLEQGRFGFTWRLLGLGFVVMSVGDLLFSYATWNGVYAPESQLNAITLAIDTSYYVSYLLLGLGAYSYRLISDPLQAARMNIVLKSLAQGNVLIFINRRGEIISASGNIREVVRTEFVTNYFNKPLGQILGLPNIVVESIITETIEHNSISNRSVKIKDSDEKYREIWLSSLLITNEQGNFTAIALVLLTELTSQQQELTPEQRMLINYYLTRTGGVTEETRVLRSYFQEQINLLYSLTRQFAGASAASKLLDHLNEVSNQNHWHFAFSGKDIAVPEEYIGQTLADRLAALLQEAKKFAGDMTDIRLVEREMSLLDGSLNADDLHYIENYNLRAGRSRISRTNKLVESQPG